MKKNLIVGVADYRVSNDAGAMLTTYALGSCIGLLLYDAAARAGGLLHFMLPSSKIDPRKADVNPAMFADTGIPLLLRELQKLGAERKRLVAHLAGGSRILDQEGLFNIGNRNHVAARNLLWRAGVMIENESVGGTLMRSVGLHIATGQIWLKQQQHSAPDLNGADEKGEYRGLPCSGGR
jgi:chemotaxis protein CheD